jgi:hypothetical protein
MDSNLINVLLSEKETTIKKMSQLERLKDMALAYALKEKAESFRKKHINLCEKVEAIKTLIKIEEKLNK